MSEEELSKIPKGFQQITIVFKQSILDIFRGPDYAGVFNFVVIFMANTLSILEKGKLYGACYGLVEVRKHYKGKYKYIVFLRALKRSEKDTDGGTSFCNLNGM